jgi:type VI secretion system protein ImpM
LSRKAVEANQLAQLSLGFYGKMPARGDFVQNNMPADFVAAWDVWLQEAIQSGQSSMGAAWPAAYLQMPIWHFALAPGVCGLAACAGILMTSVDSAGRYFPLTLVVTCPDISPGSGLPLLMLDRVDVAYALEDLALSALQPDAGFEDFNTQVESVLLPSECRVLTSLADDDNSLSMLQTVVRDGLLGKSENWRGKSLWWAQFGNRTVFSHEVGLPTASHFATMMLGMNVDGPCAETEAMPTQPEQLLITPENDLISDVKPDVAMAETPEVADVETAI